MLRIIWKKSMAWIHSGPRTWKLCAHPVLSFARSL